MTDRTPAGAPQGAYLAVREVDVTQEIPQRPGVHDFLALEELSPRLLAWAREQAHACPERDWLLCRCVAVREFVLTALFAEASSLSFPNLRWREVWA